MKRGRLVCTDSDVDPSCGDRLPLFDGPSLTVKDSRRLGRELESVRGLMADGAWWTLSALVAAITARGGHASEAGVSARIRDLRKPRFGGHTVERRRQSAGTWEYRLLG